MSCSRSRDPSDGAAADGGAAGRKAREAGNGGAAGSTGDNAVAGKLASTGGKGGAGYPSGGAPAEGSLIPVDGGYCCVPSRKPGCCMTYGGFTKDDTCGGACDGMPVPSEAWTLAKDEHGCEYWVEPREWTDCCGCEPNPRACSASGTWRIEYEEVPCGPSPERITISSDEDAGTAEVTFESRGSHGWTCGDAPTPERHMYEATASTSPNGCVVTLASHEKWCTSSEDQCQDLELKMYLHPFKDTAEVEGTYRACWCGNSGPSGTTVQVNGTAKPVL